MTAAVEPPPESPLAWIGKALRSRREESLEATLARALEGAFRQFGRELAG